MKSTDRIKEVVREKYGAIAEQSQAAAECSSSEEVVCIRDDYTQINGHEDELREFLSSGNQTISITVYGETPSGLFEG